MLREVTHLLRHAPGALRLVLTRPQAEVYDELMARADAAGLLAERRALVAELSGRVLEVGCGTGLLFSAYPEGVRVTAVEPDESFRAHAMLRARAAKVPIDVVAGDGARLPFEDGAFDAVVLGLVLCSVEDPRVVLAEVRRVLRPGGELRALEHVRSPEKLAGALMDLVDPLWLALNGQGCHLNRDAEALVRGAGLVVTHVERFQIFSAGLPAFPMRRLVARRPEEA